jgi:putative effector of murein hydrolase
LLNALAVLLVCQLIGEVIARVPRGFAAGVAAHGIGTARAFQVNELADAFSRIAMGLDGLATALLTPLLLTLLG